MQNWKRLFGEPVVVIGAIIAGLQVVNWTAIGNDTVQIIVSAVVGVLGALIARSQVSPVNSLPAQIPDDSHLDTQPPPPLESHAKPDPPKQ